MVLGIWNIYKGVSNSEECQAAIRGMAGVGERLEEGLCRGGLGLLCTMLYQSLVVSLHLPSLWKCDPDQRRKMRLVFVPPALLFWVAWNLQVGLPELLTCHASSTLVVVKDRMLCEILKSNHMTER